MPNKSPNENKLPDEAIALMENFVRDITKLRCAVIGMVLCTEPDLGIGMMRNTTGDPVPLMRAVTRIVEAAQEQGSIIDVPVLPLQ